MYSKNSWWLAVAMSVYCSTGAHASIVVTPMGGHGLTWNGNDGNFFDPGTTPTAPNNPALASNASVAFATNNAFLVAPHFVSNLNDGLYSNTESWISGDGAATIFAGVRLGTPVSLSAIAFGRDNGNGDFDDNPSGTDACGGQCDDRWPGTYTLQYTTVASPDETTPDGSWTTIGTVGYNGVGNDISYGGVSTPWLRHQFQVDLGGSPIPNVTGVRIIVPDNQIAIDEIEVNSIPEPSSLVLAAMALAGAVVARRRRSARPV